MDIQKYVKGILENESGFTGHLATVKAHYYDPIPDVVPVSFVYYDNCLYFATDYNFAHTKNIDDNQAVAISLEVGITFKGKADILGNVHKPEYAGIRGAYEKAHELSWCKYKDISSQVFVKITLIEAKFWKYIDSVPFRGWYSFETENCKLEKYSSS